MQYKLLLGCTVLATYLIVAKALPTDSQVLPAGVQQILSNKQRIEESLSEINQRVTSIRNLLTNFDTLATIRIINAIRSRNYIRANEIVRTNQVTVEDWNFIVREIYEKRENGFLDLVDFGSTLEVGNTKVVYYLTLLNLLQDNRHNSLISTVLAVRGQSFNSLNLDVLVKYNPFLSFLTFEQRLVQELQVVVRNTLLGNQLLTNSVLNGIQWEVLTGLQLESLRESQVLILQHVLNTTVVDVIRQINVTNLVGQIENINIESESNRILRLRLYGALIYAIHQVYPDHPEQFILAQSYRTFVTNVQFNVANEYLQNYINVLNTQYLHGCVQSIINAAQNNLFLIKNVRYGEFIYVVTEGFPQPQNYWKTTPSDIKRTEYRPVFSWTPKTCDHQCQWLLEYENGLFWIRNGYFTDRYLDSSHVSHVQAPASSSRQSRLAVRLIPSNIDNQNCYIQNFESSRFVYAGSNEEKEDNDRRTILSNGVSRLRDSSYLWNFSDYNL